MVEEAGRGTEGEAPRRTADIDGFNLPVPKTKAEREARERPSASSGKKDYSLFTLDYAFRKVGGRGAAIELARLAAGSDERLKGVVSGYMKLTQGQRKHKVKLLEELCIENNVDPSDFLGICCAVAHRYQLDTAAMIASIELEEIVGMGTEQAKKPEGFQDRKLIYEHSLFLPQRGPGVAVQINNAPQQLGTQLPEFKSLSEIALGAIAKAALPPAPKEVEDAGDAEAIDIEPILGTDVPR